MGKLGQIASSLMIGEMYSLRQMQSLITMNRMTGGIGRYTLVKANMNGLDLRSSNLVNNFGNGVVPRVNRANIKATNAYVYNEYGKLGIPYTKIDFIGTQYHQNDSIESSNFGFITETGFTRFEKAIRDQLLLNNEGTLNDDSFLSDYESEVLKKEIDTKKVPYKMDIGSEFTTAKNPFFIEPRENELGENGYLYERYSELRDKINRFNLFYRYNSQYAFGPETTIFNPTTGDFDYVDLNVSYEEKYAEIGNILQYYKTGVKKVTKNNGGSILDSLYHEWEQNGTEINIMGDSEGEKTKNYVNFGANTSNLIQRTDMLFRDLRIGSLVNRFHSSNTLLHDYNNDELTTAKHVSYGLSRGRNLIKKSPTKETGYDNPYCRVWTTRHQYGKLSRLIRPFVEEVGKKVSVSDFQKKLGESLRPHDVEYGKYGVLMDNGFVRMSPAHDEEMKDEDGRRIKPYMFSIENLAWRDIYESALSDEQIGPSKGRIMWFPPYNLKFSENVNVEWNANKFIGRGEQIYTYTNTDRSGTLSFTLLIDHPSIINKWRGTSKTVDREKERVNEILRFFAGCEILEGSCGDGAKPGDDKKKPPKIGKNPEYTGKMKKVGLVIFFPNNYSGYDDEDIDTIINKLSTYETNTTGEWINEQDSPIENQVYPNHNQNLFHLNNENISEKSKEKVRKTLFHGDEDIEFYSFFDSNSGYTKLNSLIKLDDSENAQIFGEKGKNIKISSIDVFGFATSHGNIEHGKDSNIGLSTRRGNRIKEAVIKYCDVINNEYFKDKVEWEIIPVSDVDNGINRNINTEEAKIGRSAYVVFNISWDAETTANDANTAASSVAVVNQEYDKEKIDRENKAVANASEYSKTEEAPSKNDYRSDNEYLYFSNLRENDEVAYQTIVEKIRYFTPAYHTVTPAGFNARLTFLHQCTRQGPTNEASSGKFNTGSSNYTKYAGNLSFGRAPYCILRIGDFFNTKICITSLSIDYDGGSGIQWDLNPEGAGVQPMFANVNINFNFIGGQDLKGPIERLQNAVTSNYYANASMYDANADVKDNKKVDVTKNKKDEDIVEKEGNVSVIDGVEGYLLDEATIKPE